MSIIETIDRYIYKLGRINGYKYAKYIPDYVFIKAKYRTDAKGKCNILNPKTFNDKLNWLKLHDRNPLYTTLLDKYLVKNYVSDIIGSEYVIPTVGAWDRFEDIDFDKLPEKFVLKCNHDSGSVVICRDRDSFDYEAAKKKLNDRLSIDSYWYSREWPYKNIKRKIICEEFLDQGNEKGLTDYKFFCFNGKPKFLYISDGLEDHETASISYLSLNWEFTPFQRNDYKRHEQLPQRPERFDEMVWIAEKLSADIPFVRVDLYNINGHIYFSEMTFYPTGGFVDFTLDEWNRKIGDMLVLPKKRRR